MKKITFYFLFIPFIVSAQWTQIGEDIDGVNEGDRFGQSIAINGDGSVFVAAAPSNDNAGYGTGQIRVFKNEAGVWSQLGQDINGEDELDWWGAGVSLNNTGNIVAASSVYHNERGHVKVYQLDGGNWYQLGQAINGNENNDLFGRDLSLNNAGDIIAVGASDAHSSTDNDTDRGHVRIYQYTNSSWTQIGADIPGDNPGDLSGIITRLNGDGSRVIISSQYNDDIENNSGQVRVFQNTGGNWTQLGQSIYGVAAEDQLGSGLAINDQGNIIAVAAMFNDVNGEDSGHVRVFEMNSGTWEQIGNDINGVAAGDLFGRSVSLNANGNVLAVGGLANDGNGLDSGHTRIFQNIGGNWVQVGDDIYGEAAADRSGIEVDLSDNGETIAVGAWLNDGNGSNSGHVRVFQNESLSIRDFNFGQDFVLYPNPTSEDVVIQFGKEYQNLSIEIYSMLGSKISNIDISNVDKIQLITSHLNTGIYTIRISNKKNVITLKLIKK